MATPLFTLPAGTDTSAAAGVGTTTPTPTSVAPIDGASFLPVTEVKGGLPRTTNVPMSIVEAGLFSPTSTAMDCFVNQKFSSKLQAYLVGYVNSIYTQYSVYK